MKTFIALCLGILIPAFVSASGELDGSFASGAFVAVPASGRAVAMMPDGRIVSARFASGGLQVQRLDRNGRPDETYGTGGVRELLQGRFSSPNLWVSAVAAAADGSVYIALAGDGIARAPVQGSTSSPSQVFWSHVLHVTSLGEVDLAFGSGGLVSFQPQGDYVSNYSFIDSIAPLAEGTVALLEVVGEGPYDCPAIVNLRRIRPDGQSLPGASGKIDVTQRDCFEPGAGILALADGVVGVPSLWVQDSNMPLLIDRYGTPLSISGLSMGATMSGSRDATVNYLVRRSSSGTQMQVTRLRPDLTADPGFGTAGSVQVDLSSLLSAGQFIGQMQLLGDGMSGRYIYLAAQLYDPVAISRLAIVRLNIDGRPDAAFGQGGVFVIEGAGWSWRLLAEQPEGGLLVEFTGDVKIVRLQSGNPQEGAGILGLVQPAYGARANEGDRVQVVVARSAGARGAVSVQYRLQGSSALPGIDYEDVHGTLSWADGESGTRSFSFSVLRNDLVNSNQGVRVLLDSPQGAAVVINNTSGVAIISPASSAPPSTPSAPSSGSSSTQQGSGGGGSMTPGSLLLLLALFMLRLRGSAPDVSPAPHLKRRAYLSVVMATLLFCGYRPATAAVGDIDPAYGQSGRAQSARILLPDGRALAALDGGYGRLDASGHPDATFGVAGRHAWPAGFDPNWAAWLRLADGGLLLGGSCAVVHLDANGEIDLTFAGTGVLVLSPRLARCRVEDLKLQSDGRLLVLVGEYYPALYLDTPVQVDVRRFDTSIVPDAGFGQNGQALLADYRTTGNDFPYIESYVARIIPLLDGRIAYIDAYSNAESAPFIDQMRTRLGYLDSTGRPVPAATADPTLDSQISDWRLVGQLPQGGTLIDGCKFTSNGLHYRLIRRDAEGRFDGAFGMAGSFTLDGGDASSTLATSVSTDGRFFYVALIGSNDTSLTRVHLQGSNAGRVDTEYGNQGTVHLNAWVGVNGVQGLADGSVLLTGSAGAFRLLPTSMSSPGFLGFATTSVGATAPGPLTVYVLRSGGADGAISVDFATVMSIQSGVTSAVAGRDYQAQNGTLTWGDGDKGAKTITLTILPEYLASGGTYRPITLELSNLAGAAWIETPRLVVYSQPSTSSPASSGTSSPTTPPATASPAGGGGAVGLASLMGLSLMWGVLLRHGGTRFRPTVMPKRRPSA